MDYDVVDNTFKNHSVIRLLHKHHFISLRFLNNFFSKKYIIKSRFSKIMEKNAMINVRY